MTEDDVLRDRAASLSEHPERIAAQPHPLTEDQRARLRAILRQSAETFTVVGVWMGDSTPVPVAVIRDCREAIAGDVPLLVGGGIREPAQAAAARAAGADFVVIGSAVETADDGRTALLAASTQAVRG